MRPFNKLTIHNPEIYRCLYLSVEFQDKSQDTMCSWMLRAEVKGQIANFLLNRNKLVVPWWHLPLGRPLIWIHYRTCTLLDKFIIWKPLLSSPLLRTETSHSHCSWVCSTPAPCVGNPRFKSWHGDWLSWLRSFVIFSSPSKQMLEEYLFHAQSSNWLFTIHPTILCVKAWATNSIVK